MEVPTQTFTGFAQMFPWARAGTAQKGPSDIRLPTQNVPYTLILRIILLLSPIGVSQAAGRAIHTWASLRWTRCIPTLRCKGKQQQPSASSSMHVVVIEETPQTMGQSSKKLASKAEQEGRPRRTPKTSGVRMKVSDTATYSREKTGGFGSHSPPLRQRRQTIRVSEKDRPPCGNRQRRFIPELDVTCCCSPSRCRLEPAPYTRRAGWHRTNSKSSYAAIKEVCFDQQTPLLPHHHFRRQRHFGE